MSLYIVYRKARRTIDTTETKREFGPVVIHYGKVQCTCTCTCMNLSKYMYMYIILYIVHVSSSLSTCMYACTCIASVHEFVQNTCTCTCISIFFCFIILFPFSFSQVQSKVNLKYDAWHKEILNKFGSLIGTDMQDFYGTVSKVH